MEVKEKFTEKFCKTTFRYVDFCAFWQLSRTTNW